ncbi:uncharacterized protein LOC141855757 [Brevipalpus obovatus]|uniref:uncharacterized protein LOC141855757 n=1 Tax=Brevipalpus obovatus TaxID=246614 RepID=UPI003D9F81D7
MSVPTATLSTLDLNDEATSMRLNERENKETINSQLYQLVVSANIEMDYELFCVILDLLRAGVCPEAIFVFLSNFHRSTKYFKRFLALMRANKVRRKAELKAKSSPMNGMEASPIFPVPKGKEISGEERGP